MLTNHDAKPTQLELSEYPTESKRLEKTLLAYNVANGLGDGAEKKMWLDIVTEDVLAVAQDKNNLAKLIAVNNSIIKCVEKTLELLAPNGSNSIGLYHCALELANDNLKTENFGNYGLKAINYFLKAKDIAEKNPTTITIAPAMKKLFIACSAAKPRLDHIKKEEKETMSYSHLDYVLLFEAAANEDSQEAIAFLTCLSESKCYAIRIMASEIIGSNQHFGKVDKEFLSGIRAYYGWKCQVNLKLAKDIFDPIINQRVSIVVCINAILFKAMALYAELENYISDKSNSISATEKLAAIEEMTTALCASASKFVHFATLCYWQPLPSLSYYECMARTQYYNLIQNTLQLLKSKGELHKSCEIIIRKNFAGYYARNTGSIDSKYQMFVYENLKSLSELTYISGKEYSISQLVIRTGAPRLEAIRLNDTNSIYDALQHNSSPKAVSDCLIETINCNLYRGNEHVVEDMIYNCNTHSGINNKPFEKSLQESIQSAKKMMSAGTSITRLLKLVLENNSIPALVKIASLYRDAEKTENALFFTTWAVLELERTLLISDNASKQYTACVKELIQEKMKFISNIASNNSTHSNLARWCQELIKFTLQISKNSVELKDDAFIKNLLLCNAHHSFYSCQLAEAIELGSVVDKSYVVDKKFLYIHPIDEVTSLPGRGRDIEMVSKSLLTWMEKPAANEPNIEQANRLSLG